MSKRGTPSITPLEDGPLRVENLSSLESEDGHIQTQQNMVLCRCGQSANQPFCDGSHTASGFSSNRGHNEKDERLVFEGDPITIYENVAICSHAGFCPRGKPDKWRPEDGEQEYTDEELIEKIRQCPSGALSYARGATEHRDQTRAAKVRIKKGGPLEIEGGIELRNTEWGEGASREHYALCRCGASSMKPFCDGSHDDVWANGEDDFEPESEVKQVKATDKEPFVEIIHEMAREGLDEDNDDGRIGQQWARSNLCRHDLDLIPDRQFTA